MIEGTFRSLDGFSVPAAGEARIHFDDAAEAGHFRSNRIRFYITSEAAKSVSVVLKVDGFAPVSVDVAKMKVVPKLPTDQLRRATASEIRKTTCAGRSPEQGIY